jgi:hypothetical protein
MMSVAAVGIVAAGSGCASVATNRYLQANNPVRIEALQAGGNVDGAILALDVFALDQVVAHPWLTTGAAVVDSAMVYGVYALGEDQEWWGNEGRSSQPQSAAAESGASAAPGGTAYYFKVTDHGKLTFISGDNSGNGAPPEAE